MISFYSSLLHIRDRLKYISEHCYNHLSANEYISTEKYYWIYYTVSILYTGNVSPERETIRWNVFCTCAGAVRMKTLNVTVYMEGFHAHYLVYKAHVQKLLHLRH